MPKEQLMSCHWIHALTAVKQMSWKSCTVKLITPTSLLGNCWEDICCYCNHLYAQGISKACVLQVTSSWAWLTLAASCISASLCRTHCYTPGAIYANAAGPTGWCERHLACLLNSQLCSVRDNVPSKLVLELFGHLQQLQEAGQDQSLQRYPPMPTVLQNLANKELQGVYLNVKLVTCQLHFEYQALSLEPLSCAYSLRSLAETALST